MTDSEAIAELKQMKPAELDLVPYTSVWWLCCYKGCYNGTRVRDYGLGSEYWKKQYGFFSVNKQFILCYKHFKFYNRLKLHYSLDHIDKKIFDNKKSFIATDEEKRLKSKGRLKVKANQKIHNKPKKR